LKRRARPTRLAASSSSASLLSSFSLAGTLMAASGAHVRGFLSLARKDARRIAREKMRWSDPISLLLNAAVAHVEGNPDAAAERLRAAATGFESAHMQLYAALARRRLDQIVGDDETRARRQQADEWMAAQGVVNPARMTRLFAPGFADPDIS
jgi:hypothetical protein